jgi:hypothetical protein
VGETGAIAKGAAIIHVRRLVQLRICPRVWNLVGQIASRWSRFHPRYRLARASSSAAIMDVEACYRGLVDKGIKDRRRRRLGGGNLASKKLQSPAGNQ